MGYAPTEKTFFGFLNTLPQDLGRGDDILWLGWGWVVSSLAEHNSWGRLNNLGLESLSDLRWQLWLCLGYNLLLLPKRRSRRDKLFHFDCMAGWLVMLLIVFLIFVLHYI